MEPVRSIKKCSGKSPAPLGAATVNVALAESDPSVAVIVLLPTSPTGVARPCEPAALLMLATPSAEEDQSTLVVRDWVEPLL